MSVGVASAFLASVVSLTIAIAILFRRPSRRLYRYFSFFSGALFLWHGSAVVNRLADGALGTWQMAAALLLPPTGVLFFRELLRHYGGVGQTWARITATLSGVLLLLNASPAGDHILSRSVMVLYIFVALGNILRNLYLNTRAPHTDTERKRVRILFYGGLVALILSSGELLPEVVALSAMGHVAATFYTYFLYQSIIARRLIDLVELLGKAAVLAGLTLVLASVYALLVLWVGRGQQGLWLFNTLVASFVILILYDQVRPWIEQATAKFLFREGYELGREVRHLLRRLRTTITQEDMATKVLDTLHGAGPTRQVCLYVQSGPGDGAFRRSGFRGPAPPETVTLAQQPVLLSELRRERRPLLLEHLLLRQQELPTVLTGTDPQLRRELERLKELITSMEQLRASVVIPIVIDEQLAGFIALGAEQITRSYSTEELAALLSVAEACAVIIENSQEYEKRRERDRLAALGEMATGMAHEIRNPLGAIKGAVQCLDPHTLPGDALPFLEVISEEVDRLSHVVAQFLEYSRPYRGTPQLVDVNHVLTATLRLLANEPVPQNIELHPDLGSNLPPVSMDPEHLRQVLINLIKNAVQAMPDGGKITLSTRVAEVSRPNRGIQHAQEVVVQVADTGPGIAPENLSNIFVPFFTTKPSGTGLGLPISQRIVENVQGRLEARSRSGGGAVFSVRLPVHSPAHATNPQQAAPPAGDTAAAVKL